jgi:tRNA dimethylallyltransferase
MIGTKNPTKYQKNILSVVGPTAVGKTGFTLRLAEKILTKNSYELIFNNSQLKILSDILDQDYSGVDIISADSRQVYKGLKILTGADLPTGYKLSEKTNQLSLEKIDYSYYQKDKIRIHGVAIIEPSQEWSLAHFKTFATKIVKNSWNNNRLPIVVGGTGLYHQNFVSDDDKYFIPPDEKLRLKAKNMSLVQLQNLLKKINIQKYDLMNNSDQNNPRRLIRTIEISQSNVKNLNLTRLPKNFTYKIIYLSDDLENIEKKISERVVERFNNGAVDEVKNLLNVSRKKSEQHLETSKTQDSTAIISDGLPAFTTLGVSEIAQYLSGKITQEECLKLWTLHEFQYAKRQLTWWKKEIDSADWVNIKLSG